VKKKRRMLTQKERVMKLAHTMKRTHPEQSMSSIMKKAWKVVKER